MGYSCLGQVCVCTGLVCGLDICFYFSYLLQRIEEDFPLYVATGVCFCILRREPLTVLESRVLIV